MKEQNKIERVQSDAGARSSRKVCERLKPLLDPSVRVSHPSARHGFTLLELLIVMSIIVILAAVALPMYQQHVQRAREVTLRTNLVEMRRMIDRYAADKGRLPQSSDDLVTAGYLREIPIDPITGAIDWQFNTGTDPNFSQETQGITDVHSSSTETSSEGTAYNEW